MAWVINAVPVADGWDLRLLDSLTGEPAIDPVGGGLVLAQPRHLFRVATEVGDFPCLQPCIGTGIAVDPTADLPRQDSPGVDALCAGLEPQVLAALYRKVVSQGIELTDMRTFGQYLFSTLLGETIWRALDAASNGCIELMLEWSPQEQSLHRLPWEMMHDATDFLAARPHFALSRRVAVDPGVCARGGWTPRPFGAPPRVLFVIGASAGDAQFDVLRPGAEYLGILRGLRQGALGLDQLPLVGASPVRLAATIESFQPDVVHFICHGDPDGTLDLLDDDRPEARKKVDADALHALLHPQGVPSHADPAVAYTGPQIVVLNACHTALNVGIALENAGQVSFPLAVSLVHKGIPLVVGMAGEVADTACRLFSRSFYASLLTDGRVGCAAAKGRRAGLLYGHEGASTIDWALPTLFVSSFLDEPCVVIQPRANEEPWHRLAQELARGKEFPAYYARLDVSRHFELLMADEGMQLKLDSRKSDLQVLGLSTRADEGQSFGRSWTLRDLAAKAARSGHVPLVIDQDLADSGDWPTDIDNFVSYLVRAATATLAQLGDPAGPSDQPKPFVWTLTLRVMKLRVGETPPDDLPPEIRDIAAIGTEYERQDMIAMAIQMDMIRYLELVRARYGHPAAKLLLLIDDMHAMGDAVAFLVKRLFATAGLRAQSRRRNDVRVLFTYSRRPALAGQHSAVNAIVDFLSQKPYAKDLELAEFRSGTEADMAYAHVLYKWHVDGKLKSLVPVRRPRPSFEWFFGEFRRMVQGVPSRLASSDVAFVVASCLRMPPEIAALREADDEDALSRTQ